MRNGERDQERAQPIRRFAAWAGLFLLLFNLSNGAPIGMALGGDLADGQIAICSSTAPQSQDQPTPHHGQDCACCLSFCCSAATAPPVQHDLAQPGAGFRRIKFSTSCTCQPHPAPSLGGSARAPPLRA